MRFSRYPRLSRMLVLLAVFQMVAPSVAAIADAWRMDRREAFAHIESESNSSCVVVHAHDCILCSVATAATGTLPAPAGEPPSCYRVAPAPQSLRTAPRATRLRAASPRAPPSLMS